MNRKLFTITLTALLTLLLSMGGATGQGPEPEEETQPQGEVSITATVNSRISYQGVLKEGGTPVTGSRDMIFGLYSDGACTTQAASDIVKNDVQVTDGLFSVELDVDQSLFNGQGLWLGVEVGGTDIVCQEILPVPYALSLRPGAHIEGTLDDDAVLHASNDGSGVAVGLWAESSASGYAGYFAGDVAQTRTSDGLAKAGVYARCTIFAPPPTIYRYFNNVADTVTLPFVSSGTCTFDFDFQIDDRYWAATAVGGPPHSCFVRCTPHGTNNDQLVCTRYDDQGNVDAGEIMVLVY
jgi:hypothetical protein